ncbi:hypothetical protein AAG747_19770 [Rapidithrix thailandica]|uniref:Uncharacterized protein n=1 Tax=Rapidithrix thailandica TaxID=413964 RepID=A0AAW9SCJ0_9BACT
MKKLFLACFTLIALLSCAPQKNFGKKVKKKYPLTYQGIEKWAYRQHPQDTKARTQSIHQQSEAFWHIAEILQNQPEEKTEKMLKVAMYRWNWLEGDPIYENDQPVDWFMVWEEYLQKTR